jgi:hypothetical protein
MSNIYPQITRMAQIKIKNLRQSAKSADRILKNWIYLIFLTPPAADPYPPGGRR